MKYIFQRISKKNLSDIASLYASSFGVSVSINELEAKYNTQDFGESYTGFIAIDEQKEVGAYYGAFPSEVNYEGKVYLCGQSGDTMTAPEHRKRGLFTSLARETYQLCKEVDMVFVFGFPNENSLPGFERKLDWKFYDKMQMFSLSNKVLFPFCELASKYSVLKSQYRNLVKFRLRKVLISSKEIEIKQIANTVVKDVKFIDYKMNKSKDIYCISMNGFKMILKTEPHLMIGEVEFFENNRKAEFIATIQKLGKLTLAKRTQLILSKNHWLYPYINEDIESTDSLPIGFYEINNEIDYSKISFSMLDYDTF
ncbi:MAG TPA: GNAT family N-acetyltransferase [Crocinitomicaceae bacterium]|nr:GNAT family N-acetyltransferase [Crocinitomicaceae bacterium]